MVAKRTGSCHEERKDGNNVIQSCFLRNQGSIQIIFLKHQRVLYKQNAKTVEFQFAVVRALVQSQNKMLDFVNHSNPQIIICRKIWRCLEGIPETFPHLQGVLVGNFPYHKSFNNKCTIISRSISASNIH